MTREEAKLHMILRREELKHSVGDLDEDIKAFDMATKALEHEPKIGRWIVTNQHALIPSSMRYNCSECGHIRSRHDGDILNFCPNCGADMRGDKDERG